MLRPLSSISSMKYARSMRMNTDVRIWVSIANQNKLRVSYQIVLLVGVAAVEPPRMTEGSSCRLPQACLGPTGTPAFVFTDCLRASTHNDITTVDLTNHHSQHTSTCLASQDQARRR